MNPDFEEMLRALCDVNARKDLIRSKRAVAESAIWPTLPSSSGWSSSNPERPDPQLGE